MSSQTVGASGASPSSRATTTLNHSRSARSASRDIASCKRLQLEHGEHVPDGDPRLGQPFPDTGRDLTVPGRSGPQSGQFLARGPLQLGQPADHRAADRFGRLVGDQPVESAPQAGCLPRWRRAGPSGSRKHRPPRRTAPSSGMPAFAPQSPRAASHQAADHRVEVVQRAISWLAVAARFDVASPDRPDTAITSHSAGRPPTHRSPRRRR